MMPMSTFTKVNIFRAFLGWVWLTNVMLVLDLLDVVNFSNRTFIFMGLAAPVLFYAFVAAKPPEPDAVTIAKLSGTALAVMTVLIALKTQLGL